MKKEATSMLQEGLERIEETIFAMMERTKFLLYISTRDREHRYLTKAE